MLLSSFTDDVHNADKYAGFSEKLDVYRAKLAAGVKDPYKIPTDQLPLQEELDKGINAVEFAEKFFTEQEKYITEMPGVELAALIAAGKLSSVEVFQAYAKRATIAHQLTNCAMELFIDEGLERAKQLDAYFAEHNKTVGPLHGLPLSLKEHYDYEGKITHAGFVSWVERVSPKSAKTLEDLAAQGAVFYIRTSQPQCLMHLCSNNNITGRTRNPWNTSLTPGGSSSGEGALAAMKGSVFGLGSDIGGSIRCPAGHCGVWGIRPSQKRVSLMRTSCGLVEQIQETTVAVLGPLARNAEDINLFMKATLDREPWKEDPDVLPIPWRAVDDVDPKSLKIAIVYDDGFVRPTPPVTRALEEAAEKLKQAGTTVVEWKNIDVKEIVAACYKSYTADGNHSQKSHLKLSGEPILELTKTYFSFGSGDKGLNGRETQQINYIRDKGRADYTKQFNDEKIDFILSPVYVSVATKPETCRYWGYTCLWNILDFPNVVFPSGLHVDEKLDTPKKDVPFRNELEKYEYSLYTDAKEFAGAPIPLQLTGRRYTDESVVKGAKALHKIISG